MNARARILPPADAGDDPVNGSALGHQPALLAAFNRLYSTLWSHGELDHPAKEIARLRNARTVNCVFCRNARFSQARDDGLTEDKVEQINDAFEDSTLDARSKLIIRYADVFLKDPQSLKHKPDLQQEMLREFTPAQVVELTAALALFMGFSKIAVSVGGMPESMPPLVVPTPH
jgi:alkylhydroperoxidase family enzyme